MKATLLIVVATLGIGCAFSNTNPFTGETKWTMGDACNDCGYDENGYPTKGQASGPLSEQAADVLRERYGSEYIQCTEELEECRDQEEPIEDVPVSAPVEAPVEEQPVEGPAPPPMADEDEVHFFDPDDTEGKNG